MASTFSWLDHSDRDRRRMMDAIDRFKETDTRDELGLGPLRDGFADLFFPGTSTIQTRARYFLFIPWCYKRVEARASADNIASKLRREEVRARDALMTSGDDAGVIGKRKGAGTKRLASSIYWLGLASWRIRLFPGSQEDYHRSFESWTRRSREGLRTDDDERVDGRSGYAWHPNLPETPNDFPEVASFDLPKPEAEYLAERITLSAPESLLAFLVRKGHTLEAPYIWAHPQFAEFSHANREALLHAQNLAEVSQGAALLYNLMLSEELPAGEHRDQKTSEYRERLERWCGELQHREGALSRWDRGAFWNLAHQIANVRSPTRSFVDTWYELRGWRSADELIASRAARALIRDRELRLKGRGRARLGNPRALELWGGDAGTGRLTYRWEAARRVLLDIHAGLNAEETDARA